MSKAASRPRNASWAQGDHRRRMTFEYFFIILLIRPGKFPCRPSLQSLQALHLNALNTNILDPTFLHGHEELTWPYSSHIQFFPTETFVPIRTIKRPFSAERSKHHVICHAFKTKRSGLSIEILFQGLSSPDRFRYFTQIFG